MIPSYTIPLILRVLSSAVLLLLFTAASGRAQLRPLDPTDFRVLRDGHVRVQIGGGVFFDQHASLAGTKGRLVEVGNIRTSWRSGRIVLELAGTIQRLFSDEVRVQPPADGVRIVGLHDDRHDAGDYRVQTILRLSGDTAANTFLLRFGTRLPTTDNRVGLDRDQTDFFALFGAARSIAGLYASAEAGVGINGTRDPSYEQSDVLIYTAALERPGWLAPFAAVAGQQDFHDWRMRGNEDLGELRLGVRVGSQYWVRAFFVRGFHEFSPRSGFVLNAGVFFGK